MRGDLYSTRGEIADEITGGGRQQICGGGDKKTVGLGRTGNRLCLWMLQCPPGRGNPEGACH